MKRDNLEISARERHKERVKVTLLKSLVQLIIIINKATKEYNRIKIYAAINTKNFENGKREKESNS